MSLRKLALFIIFVVVVVAASTGCLTVQPILPDSIAQNRPCRDGLFIVEQQPDAPVSVTVLKTSCPNPHNAGAGFQVESNVRQPIQHYEVRLIHSYDGVVDSYDTFTAGARKCGSVFCKDDSFSESTGFALKRGWFKDPEPKLTFTVWSVTFADGTTWKRSGSVPASLL